MSYDPARTLTEMALTEQMSGTALPPLPRRKLGRGIVTLLILLRIYVIVAIPVVGYAFVRALLATHH